MQNSSYFIKNRALFGCYPKQKHVDELIQNGVRYFVNLTSPNESKIKPYSISSDCVQICFPIKDHNVPKDWEIFSRFVSKLSNIITTLPTSHKVYVHCRGGHGRAGMIVAILLCHIHQIEPIEALKQTSAFHAKRPNIKAKWKAIGSPHEYRQRAFVYRFFEPLNMYRIQYKDEYDNGFSRFSHHPITVEGKEYSSIEGALLEILNASSEHPVTDIDFTRLHGKEAFMLRKNFEPIKLLQTRPISPEWKKKRIEALTMLFEIKLKQHPKLKTKLMRSGFRPITMHARGNFTWPCNDGVNVAGKILMEIRHRMYNTS